MAAAPSRHFRTLQPSPIVSAQSSWSRIPNKNLSAAAASAHNRAALAARTTPASVSASSPVERQYLTSGRRAPPPPPSRRRIASVTSPLAGDDPFADGPLELQMQFLAPESAYVPRSLIASRTRVMAHTIPAHEIPTPGLIHESTPRPGMLHMSRATAPPPCFDPPMVVRNPAPLARGRLVASVLLNRRCGRPLSRRLSIPGEDRTYVPSALSHVVELEA